MIYIKIKLIAFLLLTTLFSIQLNAQKDQDIYYNFNGKQLTENRQDSFYFPQKVQFFKVMVSAIGFKTAQYLVFNVTDDKLILIPFDTFENSYPNPVSFSEMIGIPMADIRYVKLKSKQVYGSELLRVNSLLIRFIDYILWENKNLIKFTLVGLLSDLIISAVITPSFPVITLVFSSISLVKEFVAFVKDGERLMKESQTANNYLIREKNKRFRYFFKLKDREYNLRAMQSLQMQVLTNADSRPKA